MGFSGQGHIDAAPERLPAKIKSCILIFYYGGPSHLDTFDMKPHAPAEVRGEFQPIATSVPGLQIGEHLPHTARVMDRVAVIHGMQHQMRGHDSASYEALTGTSRSGPTRSPVTARA